MKQNQLAIVDSYYELKGSFDLSKKNGLMGLG